MKRTTTDPRRWIHAQKNLSSTISGLSCLQHQPDVLRWEGSEEDGHFWLLKTKNIQVSIDLHWKQQSHGMQRRSSVGGGMLWLCCRAPYQSSYPDAPGYTCCTVLFICRGSQGLLMSLEYIRDDHVSVQPGGTSLPTGPSGFFFTPSTLLFDKHSVNPSRSAASQEVFLSCNTRRVQWSYRHWDETPLSWLFR